MSEPINNGNGTTYPVQPAQPGPYTQVVEHLDLRDLMLERGSTGLRRAGGFISEEFEKNLQGLQALHRFREMCDNSPVVGASLFSYDMLLRQVTATIQPADDSDEALRWKEAIESMLFRDTSMPWAMQQSEIRSYLPYGFSLMEIVLKRRLGMNPGVDAQGQPLPTSRFDDGLIGVHKLAPRAQETIFRWEFDAVGDLRGAHQLDPYGGRGHAMSYLPIEKLLHFRATSFKENPLGRSVLRTAYRPYYLLTHEENTEAIGHERTSSGFPMIGTPPQWWAADATPDQIGQLEYLKRVGRNLRVDEETCFVYPLLFDATGNQLLKLEFAAPSAGRGIADMDKTIQRYELRIMQSMLTDLIWLGHEQAGSWALHGGKTNILGMALAGFCKAEEDVYNSVLIPLLCDLNAVPEDKRPCLQYGDVESPDLDELGNFILKYAGAGFETADLENTIRLLAGWPERDEEVIEAAHAHDDARAQQQAAVAPGQGETPGAGDLEALAKRVQAPQTGRVRRRRGSRTAF
jgi:hypothetical protein